MLKKYKTKLKKIADQLFILNQAAIEDDDDDTKKLTCYLIEILQNNDIS